MKVGLVKYEKSMGWGVGGTTGGETLTRAWALWTWAQPLWQPRRRPRRQRDLGPGPEPGRRREGA